MGKRYINLTGETVDFSTYITRVGERWYVARWVERACQWVGPLRPAVRKASGCHSFYARTAEGVPGAGGYSYSRRADAVRAVVRMYGMQEAVRVERCPVCRRPAHASETDDAGRCAACAAAAGEPHAEVAP